MLDFRISQKKPTWSFYPRKVPDGFLLESETISQHEILLRHGKRAFRLVIKLLILKVRQDPIKNR